MSNVYAFDPRQQMPGQNALAQQPMPAPRKPDRPEYKPDLSKLKKYFEEARDILEECRKEAEDDRDYFDGKQWTQEERSTLRRRKQPTQTYNLVRVAIEGTVGVVERSKTDPKGLPRNDPDEESADVVTKVLRYISDTNRLDRLRVKAAYDYFIEGVCGAIIEVEPDKIDYKVTIRRLQYREVFYDPFSQESDFSDARYMGVAKWMDQSDVELKWKAASDKIASSMDAPVTLSQSYQDRPWQGWADRRRKRLLVVEMYHREGDQWARCVFIAGGELESGWSDYENDEGNPICPMELEAFARDRDNYPYGAVRNLKSPQDGVNKRESKLLHMLNVRQTFGSKSAIAEEGVDKVKTELAKPDGHVEINHGVWGQDFGVIPVTDQVAGQFQLLQLSMQQMARLSPTPGIVGRTGGDQSGKAILAEQNAGMTELAAPFGGMTDWERRILTQCWWRAKQYWTMPRFVRVTDDIGKTDFTKINEPVLDQMGFPVRDPRTGQPQMQNRLMELDMDVTVDVAPEQATLQHEQFALLADLAGKGLPIPAEVLIKAAPGLRDKKAIIDAIMQQKQAAAQPNPVDVAKTNDMNAAAGLKGAQTQKIQIESGVIAGAGAPHPVPIPINAPDPGLGIGAHPPLPSQANAIGVPPPQGMPAI